MKIFFIIILLVPLNSASFFDQNSTENCDHSPPQFKSTSAESENSTDTERKCAYSKDSPTSDFVHFHFFGRGFNDYQKLPEDQMTQRLNQSLPTYIILHGIRAEVGDNENGWMKAMGKQILENTDANVILIDYGSVSYCDYIFLSTNWVYQISKYIGDCVIEKWNLSPNQIKVIGHSLGGHIAGLVGSHLNGQVEEIIALDPAGPLFDGQILDIRQDTLSSNCAQFVQVLHTAPILLGTFERLGDCDFFANMLSPQQPGCDLSDIICSHSRAYELYFASMFPENEFIGNASLLSSDEEKISRFGFFNDRKNGTFYFDTTSCFGYAE